MREDGLNDPKPGPSLRERIQHATGAAPVRPTIRVMVVDDSEIIRVGLVQMLQTFPNLAVIGQARDGQEAVELCCQQHPDVVLMDIQMPRLNGIDATRLIRAQCPATRILALTISDDPTVIEQMLKAGALSYLLKGVTALELVDAITRACAGQAALPVRAVERTARRKPQRPPSGSK
jgi:DNA-binding NarL/FixJ family response regulator